MQFHNWNDFSTRLDKRFVLGISVVIEYQPDGIIIFLSILNLRGCLLMECWSKSV